ncbi:hypothetical protein [Streptomyces sp. NPDC048338]|uniref:hypothetical protein n=1 Tax=Streptomyces sp. NPDC048338 TaxID=3365536 RepID=UPI0037191602
MNLRTIGLTAVVVGATLLPLVASAGPAGGPTPGHGAGPGPQDDAKSRGGRGLVPGLGLTDGTSAAVPATPPAPPEAAAQPAGTPARAAHCGPELTSPDGVEAQTCVLGEGPDTWARTYYRNVTGHRLDAVVTLMGPAGRTVQVHCSVSAQDEPGVCETPRERTGGTETAYSAIAEFAGAGEGGDSPLLLRAGSNTAGGNGG